MKKILLLFSILIAISLVIFSSCSKENSSDLPNDKLPDGITYSSVDDCYYVEVPASKSRTGSYIPPILIKGGYLYTRNHSWIDPNIRVGGTYAIGISDYYGKCLVGDVVFIDCAQLQDKIFTDQVYGSIEGTAAIGEIYAPVSGEIVGINYNLQDNPGIINLDPYEEGWTVKILLKDGIPAEYLSGKNPYLLNSIQYTLLVYDTLR